MPKEQNEFDAVMNNFSQNGQSVIFMFQFHTHPGGSRPSGRDLGNIDNLIKRLASVGASGGGHFPIGIANEGPVR